LITTFESPRRLTFLGQHFDNGSRLGDLGHSRSNISQLDTRKVVNVVITKGFNSSPEEVQTQALEVIQPFLENIAGLTRDSPAYSPTPHLQPHQRSCSSGRIYVPCHCSEQFEGEKVHEALGMPFSDNSGFHLYEADALKNDRIFISHRHDVEDGFPNLEDMGDSYMWDEQGSSYSNLQKSEDQARTGPRFIDFQVRKFCLVYS